MAEPVRHKQAWMAAFIRELFSMPRRHMLVFLVATLLLVGLEIEFMEGWRLVHLLELLGVMVFFYLLWAAWRARSTGLRG